MLVPVVPGARPLSIPDWCWGVPSKVAWLPDERPKAQRGGLPYMIIQLLTQEATCWAGTWFLREMKVRVCPAVPTASCPRRKFTFGAG